VLLLFFKLIILEVSMLKKLLFLSILAAFFIDFSDLCSKPLKADFLGGGWKCTSGCDIQGQLSSDIFFNADNEHSQEATQCVYWCDGAGFCSKHDEDGYIIFDVPEQVVRLSGQGNWEPPLLPDPGSKNEKKDR
jgi:hypothetical protein